MHVYPAAPPHATTGPMLVRALKNEGLDVDKGERLLVPFGDTAHVDVTAFGEDGTSSYDRLFGVTSGFRADLFEDGEPEGASLYASQRIILTSELNGEARTLARRVNRELTEVQQVPSALLLAQPLAEFAASQDAWEYLDDGFVCTLLADTFDEDGKLSAHGAGIWLFDTFNLGPVDRRGGLWAWRSALGDLNRALTSPWREKLIKAMKLYGVTPQMLAAGLDAARDAIKRDTHG